MHIRVKAKLPDASFFLIGIQPVLIVLIGIAKTDNTADIKAKTEELQKAFSEIATKVYQAAGAAAQAQQDAGAGAAQDNGNGSDFVDADFKDAE